MRLLLDTHVALWAIVDDERLSSRARDLIGEPGNIIVVSAASVWEITIKHGLARGAPSDMPISGKEALGFFRTAGYSLLSVTPEHVAAVADLAPLHRDPFDRLLVAQALYEPLRLITHDRHLLGYSDAILLA